MFKKIVVSVVVSAMTFSAVAAQDIHLTFKDGSSASYKNVPDSVDNDQFARVLMRDYGKDFNTDVDYSKSRIIDVEDAIVVEQSGQAAPKTSFWDTTAGKVVTGILVVGIAVALIRAFPIAGAGGCKNTWDIAKDGSRCGGRAASVRPGGN